jgi:hypothetical protein
MKKAILIILVLAVAAVILAAANPWPARLEVINRSEQGVIVNMGYPYSYLHIPAGGSRTFTIERDVYAAAVTACGVTKSGTMDMTKNLRLTFTPCGGMKHSEAPRYPGERSMEKPNWESAPAKPEFQFQY